MSHAAELFRALPLTGKGIALLLSASIHAAVALAAVRGAPHAAPRASVPTEPTLEISALELALSTPPLLPLVKQPTAPLPPAPHHHDYPVQPDHDATAHDAALRHVLPLPSTPSSLPEPAPVVLDSPPPATPRFVLAVGPAARAEAGPSVGHGGSALAASAASAEPAPEATVDTPAKLLAGGTPSYTREAEEASIEADVPLEIVVDARGSVIAARALSHVGYGLDEAALRSVRGYRFSPARRAGQALPVRMRWLMRFQLR